MIFEFGRRSQLHGKEVRVPMDDFSFVPCSEHGETEYIFVYDGLPVPGPDEEPDLYSGADVKKLADDEIEIRYKGIDEVVILLSKQADERFRRENPEMVAKNEKFVIRS